MDKHKCFALAMLGLVCASVFLACGGSGHPPAQVKRDPMVKPPLPAAPPPRVQKDRSRSKHLADLPPGVWKGRFTSEDGQVMEGRMLVYLNGIKQTTVVTLVHAPKATYALFQNPGLLRDGVCLRTTWPEPGGFLRTKAAGELALTVNQQLQRLLGTFRLISLKGTFELEHQDGAGPSVALASLAGNWHSGPERNGEFKEMTLCLQPDGSLSGTLGGRPGFSGQLATTDHGHFFHTPMNLQMEGHTHPFYTLAVVERPDGRDHLILIGGSNGQVFFWADCTRQDS